MNSNNYYLLDKHRATNFFNKNSKNIFGDYGDVEILEIKRSHTYNPDNYNILYRIIFNNIEQRIRLSTSRIVSKEKDFLVMNYLKKKNFHGHFSVPNPITYIENENLLFYHDIPGLKLTDILGSSENLTGKIKSIAKLLNLIHGNIKIDFKFPNSDYLFENYNYDLIAKSFTIKKALLKTLITKAKKISTDCNLEFCHGDFNPNNILFNQKNITLIDFGSTCMSKKELDIASFIVHLEIMLHKEKKDDIFIKLKKIFIENCDDFDSVVLDNFCFAINLRLLEIALVYPWSDYNQSSQPFIYELLKKNINNIL